MINVKPADITVCVINSYIVFLPLVFYPATQSGEKIDDCPVCHTKEPLPDPNYTDEAKAGADSDQRPLDDNVQKIVNRFNCHFSYPILSGKRRQTGCPPPWVDCQLRKSSSSSSSRSAKSSSGLVRLPRGVPSASFWMWFKPHAMPLLPFEL